MTTEEPLGPTPEVEVEISDNDRLLAALSYPIGIIAIIILVVEDMRKRPFQKYHAVQAIAVNLVLWVLWIILSTVTLGILGCAFPLVFLLLLWPAYKAYKGEWVTLPLITDFIKKQNWV